MSQQLINRSPDLKKLRDEGYEITIISGYLVMQNVPYVNSKREIEFGSIVSELTLSGNRTTTPNTHVVSFSGNHPCDKDGAPLTKLVNGSGENKIAEGLVTKHTFSSKPQEGYSDYYKKMSTYAAILSSQAQAIDSEVSPITFNVIETADQETVFNYIDTASSRAEITAVTQKLELQKVAIIGLGGTGSYILDLMAKTPVREIHIFDGDKFLQHNAFRSPGAASISELKRKPKKVKYLASIYSKMHRGIIVHDYPVDLSNIDELKIMNFVFLSLDDSEAKKVIVQKLEEFGISFIDVGIGVYLVDDALGGQLRVTTSTEAMRSHVREKNRIPFGKPSVENEYIRNIQIADLNSLNATLAVIKWKKLMGFYQDFDQEHFSVYTIDGNKINNEDKS